MVNPTQRKKRSRLTKILLLPAFLPIFVFGWSLYWIGLSKRNPKRRPNNKTPKNQEQITIGVIPKEELTINA